MQFTMSPYSPGGGMFSFGATDAQAEEERKRKEEEARQQLLIQQQEAAKTTPVKQTITTDPDTGEQTMKIEGRVEDLSAANPRTPTVTAPVAPSQMPPAVTSPVATPTIQARPMPPMPEAPAPAPAPQAAPSAPPPDAAEVQRRQQMFQQQLAQARAGAQPQAAVAPTPLPQPGAGVQVAGAPGAPMPRLAPPATTPTGQTQVAAPAPAPSLAQAGAQAAVTSAPAPAPAPTFESRFTEASTDAMKLLQLANDSTIGKEQQLIARKQASELLNRQVGETRGKEELASMSENDIARLIKSKSEEGSWAKMLLLGFISPDLAGKEAAKLGLNDKWAVGSSDDGKSFLYKTRDGIPIEGYDSTTGKKLGAKELISAVGMTTGSIDIVGGTYVSDTLKDANGQPLVGRVVSNKKTGTSYIQTDEGRKPMAGFRPQSSSGSLDAQRVAQIQRQNIDLATDWAKLQMRVQGSAPEAANKFLGEFNAKYRTNYPLSSLSGAAPQISLESGQMISPPAAPAQTAPAQAAPAQTAPAQAAPARVTTPPAGTTTQKVAGGGVSTSNISPAQLEQNMALGKTQAQTNIETNAIVQREKLKPGAKAEGEQAAIDIKNQAFADRTYDLFKPINEAILKSTGSTIGAGVDTLGAVIGKSTEGSKAISRLNVLSYNILANIPRFEGPQSDIDVQMYKQAAGDFNNRKLPVEDRLAALDALRTILQRYDKAGRNDWTFGAGGQQGGGAGAGTTSSGNKYKRVQ